MSFFRTNSPLARQQSTAGQGNLSEEPGAVAPAESLQHLRHAKERRLCYTSGAGTAEHPFPFAALLRVSGSTGWRLQFSTGSSEQGFAVER